MVPHVPVCMYAHAREGDMHLAERVKKKTRTKWDRDQLGFVSLTREKNAPAASSCRFLGLVKHNVDARL